MDFPCSLDAVLPIQHYNNLCSRTLQTLLKRMNVALEVKTTLETNVKIDGLNLIFQKEKGLNFNLSNMST